MNDVARPPMPSAPDDGYIPCRIATLPDHMVIQAAERANEANPANRLAVELASLHGIDPGTLPSQHLAVLNGKYWKPGTVITVGFLDNPDAATRRLILAAANIWHDKGVNLSFAESATDPMIRIARTPGQGYWSYIGTDILSVPANEQTMNLDGFTARTDPKEFKRVVPHEHGHSAGFLHEIGIPDLFAKIDMAKAVPFYEQWQGWSEAMVRQQIALLMAGTYRSTPRGNPRGVMCYEFPASVTVDDVEIPGGTEVTDDDAAFGADVYPGLASPPVVPPTPPIAPDRLNLSGWMAISSNAIRGVIGADGLTTYNFNVAPRPIGQSSGGESYFTFQGQAAPQGN